MAQLVSLNPATGAAVGKVEVTPVEAIPRLTERARAAQPAWQELGLDGRRKLLESAGERLQERSDELGRLITQEMGKPLPEAVGEVRYCGASLTGILGEIAQALEPEVLEDERTRSVVHHDPFGVCACITPWNFPVGMPHSTVIPALMAGNTVLFKPSEETPLVGEAYAAALSETLPDGVLQVIHGADEQGKALVAADVDLIAFTGSRETGKHILKTASDGLKRVVLELGGKDPLVVLDGADVPAAATFAARNSFRNCGQVCVSTERIYVHERVADGFVEALIEETERLQVGDGLAEGTSMGPMVNTRQRDHVLTQIDQALAEGAKLAYGGQGHHGNFIMPTVLTGVSHDMAIARDETFGPVACVTRVRDEDEAVRLANDTDFGLGAVVFGGEEQARRAARRLTAGMIGINRSMGGVSGTPWVGARQSGYGFHSSQDGHRQFAQTRVVSEPRPS